MPPGKNNYHEYVRRLWCARACSLARVSTRCRVKPLFALTQPKQFDRCPAAGPSTPNAAMSCGWAQVTTMAARAHTCSSSIARTPESFTARNARCSGERRSRLKSTAFAAACAALLCSVSELPSIRSLRRTASVTGYGPAAETMREREAPARAFAHRPKAAFDCIGLPSVRHCTQANDRALCARACACCIRGSGVSIRIRA
mmetsp:Transcript_32018/g.105992  ORF Transcript_32018/g.105992 Transcript_32018/m.105992 type:complete len:201 (-) Transcript_32018:683-1285(-)